MLFFEIVKQLRESGLVSEISVGDFHKDLKNTHEDNIIVIDLRTKDIFDAGHIRNAASLPGYLLTSIESILKRPEECNKKIYLICYKGNKSLLDAKTLMNLGYKNVHSVKGGMTEYVTEGYDTVVEESKEENCNQLPGLGFRLGCNVN